MKLQRVTGKRLLLVGTLVSAALLAGNGAAQGDEPPAGFIRGRGSVRPVEFVDVRNRLGGTSRVTWLVKSGAKVREGDIIARLDNSELEDQIEASEIELSRLRKDLDLAKFKLEAAKQAGESKVELAEKAVAVAALHKERVVGDGGELAVKELELVGKLVVAEMQLKSIKTQLAQLDGPQAKSQKSTLESQAVEAQQAVRIVAARLRLLKELERKQRLAEVELAIAEQEAALRNARNTMRTEERMAAANVEAIHTESQIAEKRLERARERLANAEVQAPAAGVATVSRLKPGVLVREGQSIVRIQTQGPTRVAVVLNRSDVGDVESGQVARVVLDATPDRVWKGVVERVLVGPRPLVLVALAEKPPVVRQGMTATVDIGTKPSTEN